MWPDGRGLLETGAILPLCPEGPWSNGTCGGILDSDDGILYFLAKKPRPVVFFCSVSDEIACSWAS